MDLEQKQFSVTKNLLPGTFDSVLSLGLERKTCDQELGHKRSCAWGCQILQQRALLLKQWTAKKLRYQIATRTLLAYDAVFFLLGQLFHCQFFGGAILSGCLEDLRFQRQATLLQNTSNTYRILSAVHCHFL